MDGFPFNLVLAVATASMTIFIGILPTKTIRSSFFGKEAFKAALVWVGVALVVPSQVMHYYLFFALLCGVAWWQFRDDQALRGKMCLSVASGLGISLGGMLVLATTPAYFPMAAAPARHLELSQMTSLAQVTLIASIYLGGAVIGLAYVTYILTRQVSTRSGVTHAQVQRYAKLLLVLALVRAVAVIVAFYTLGQQRPLQAMHLESVGVIETVVMLGLLLLVMPALAFYVKWASRMASRVQPTRALVAMIVLGSGAEVLARLLVF